MFGHNGWMFRAVIKFWVTVPIVGVLYQEQASYR